MDFKKLRKELELEQANGAAAVEFHATSFRLVYEYDVRKGGADGLISLSVSLASTVFDAAEAVALDRAIYSLFSGRGPVFVRPRMSATYMAGRFKFTAGIESVGGASIYVGFAEVSMVE